MSMSFPPLIYYRLQIAEEEGILLLPGTLYSSGLNALHTVFLPEDLLPKQKYPDKPFSGKTGKRN